MAQKLRQVKLAGYNSENDCFLSSVPKDEKSLIMIELNEEQRLAVLSGKPVRIVLPEIGKTVVLLSEQQYQRLCDLLEEEEDRKTQEAFLKASHQSAVAWMKENPY